MKIIFSVAIFTIIYLVGLDFSERYLDSWEYQPPTEKQVEEMKIEAVITGAVKNPGSYTLQAGSTLFDLIKLAGGTLENIDNRAFNDYIEVTNNSSYYLPFMNLDHNNMDTKISINSSTSELLEKLPGIGETYASRIIEYRNNHGDFQYLEQVKQVVGIGEVTFENIKNLITL